jgi:hypothetical protein
VSDQVSHPYKSTGKIIVLYNLIFKFLGNKLEDKIFCTEREQAFPAYVHIQTTALFFAKKKIK